MNVQNVKIDLVIPYEKNPRKNDKAAEAVAASIQEFGFKVPIVIDKNNVIVTGHTRLKAAKKLGLEYVPCIMADDLSEAQIKAFRLADNKTAELADWDMGLLGDELTELADLFDMSEFGFTIAEPTDEKYTRKIDIPQYEPTGYSPEISELLDETKAKQIIDEIEAADIAEDIKQFLKKAACRHYVFNYRNIAEYYANAPAEIQELMERSALVIIDFDDAIKHGYVKLFEGIEALRGDDNA